MKFCFNLFSKEKFRVGNQVPHFDEVIEIGPLSLQSAREMFKAFYGRDGIATYHPRTGAELQQMFSTKSAAAAEAELSRQALIAQC